MDVETKGTWGQWMQGNPGITGMKRAPYCMRLMEKEKTDFIKIQVCMLQFRLFAQSIQKVPQWGHLHPAGYPLE